MLEYSVYHSVSRVLSFFSSSRDWDSPNPSPAGECASPPFGSGGRGTLAGESPNSNEGTYTVVLSMYFVVSTEQFVDTGTRPTYFVKIGTDGDIVKHC